MGGDINSMERSAQIIDLSDPSPAWTDLPDINVARAQQFTSTLLPDGRVFVAGGVTGGADGGACEIFDPKTPGDGWAIGSAMQYARTYHSSFLMLRDGSVLGGGAPPNDDPPAVYTPHERFLPDYFDAIRPTITNAPAAIDYAANFEVSTPTPADVSEVS